MNRLTLCVLYTILAGLFPMFSKIATICDISGSASRVICLPCLPKVI